MADGKGEVMDRALVERIGKLDLQSSPLEDLQLARVVTRKQQALTFYGYSSDNDDSDADEEDGRMHTRRERHDNGNMRYLKTYQNAVDAHGRPYERLVEEKHFDVDGVCRVDVHFALGQSYLYRKHYFANQRLKSESVFWVEDEVTMACIKTGWWRQYYDTGNVASEMQYDHHGIRMGFCKRYAPDGVIEWVKDYTKDYQERLAAFNRRKGELSSLSVMEAAKQLGFEAIPETVKEVNSVYRTKCAPVHPDKTPDPDATEVFISLSRARDVLVAYFEKKEADAGKKPNGV
ncbi:hypothetical protein MMPV_001584 [Pyropia vietnamensis]